MAQDHVQHGIDDNPHGDAKKGAALGGLGGVAVGAAAGSLAGPVGTIVGAVVGGLSGALGSGAAVAAVDAVDNDNTVSGVGGGATSDLSSRTWDDVKPHYRQGWEQHYGQSGGKFEDNEAAHRYAWETRTQPNYRGREFADVEADLQTDWAARNPNRNWSDVSASVRQGWDSTGEVLRLHEERLEAQKQTVQTGEVSLRKEVVTEQKTIEVPVTREEVVIERHPVSGVEASDFAAEGETIRIPVSEEQVTVTKTPVVTEEVSIGKRTVQETQTVSDTVRREEAHIEQTGNVRTNQSGNSGTNR